MSKLIKEIHDEAEHIIGTEADYHKEVAIKNAKRIKKLAKEFLNKETDLSKRLVDECYANIREEIGFIKEKAGETLEEARENLDGHIDHEAIFDINTECALISLQLSLIDKLDVPSDVRDQVFENEARDWAYVVETAEDS